MTASRFSDEALASWRKLLQAEARQLREAIEFDRQQLDGRADSLPSAFDDGRDEPATDVLRDVAVSELARRARELDSVEAALARIDEGVYGTCVECGNGIAIERLRASPHSTTCLACQSIRERSRGHALRPPRL
ncbi:MAG: TraR/DksA family transcriptional regulator [Burkholderiales bacterium]|nr:TraR/DksA family transcriptional regulator [Burkholderiales bacterium]